MNVVVLAAHGLHCRWLGPYGNEWVATPALDALAGEAVVFDRHFADDPAAAGVDSLLPPDVRRSLRALGVTLVLVDDSKGDHSSAAEWDQVVRTNPASVTTPGDALLAAVETALSRAPADRWLLWIETDRLVPPWDFDFETYQHYAAAAGGFTGDHDSDDEPEPPAPTDQPAIGSVDPSDDRLWHQLRSSFGAAVTSFDTEVGALTRLFRERGFDQSAAWVVTSGYGWPVAEHGWVSPAGSRLHAELVHLPLLIRLPGGREGMRRVPTFTQSHDLAATIANLFEVMAPAHAGSVSLLPLLTGQPLARDSVRSTSGSERAIRTADWAYLTPTADQPARLYRRPDDQWEVNDLAPRHPDECDRLAALLDDKPTEGS
jgi:arylsulfatase A-like enzyme